MKFKVVNIFGFFMLFVLALYLIFPNHFLNTYIIVSEWINSTNKKSSIRYYDYNIILPEKWFFDKETNNSSFLIKKSPQSLGDIEFIYNVFNVTYQDKKCCNKLTKKLDSVKPNKYNFKCILEKQIFLICKNGDNPFIFNFVNPGNKKSIKKNINYLMKNIKIMKVK